MNKHCIERKEPLNNLKYNLKIMRITLFFLFFCILFSSASNSYSQEFTIKSKTASIKEVCREIEKNSDYIFVFSDNSEKLVEKKVNIEANSKNVTELLDALFSNTSLTYKILDKQIVVYESKENTRLNTVSDNILQQQNIVRGKVTDEQGEPLPGVTITIVGTTKGVITDIDGSYTIEAKPADKLVFAFLGMESQIVDVLNQTIINIQMSEKKMELDEVTIVAFGKQKKESVVGAITTVKPSDLQIPSSNLTTALAGRISGIISYQRSGEPGQDNADFFIRGVTTFGYKKDPLILIDNIEATSTDLARLQTDDIASFSIMKDATSTALYGARGANGVILINTKEGREGEIKVTVRAENSFSAPTQNIEFADPITYMRLGNEAVLTRDPLGTLPYSREKIDKTALYNRNRIVYPATDWQNELFKNFSSNQRINLNASGGGNIAQYYLSAAFNQDNGILNVDKRNNFNNNINLKTYSLRSNININLTKTTEALIRFSGVFDDYVGPIDGGTDIYNQVVHTNPVLFPPYYLPDVQNESTSHILFGNYGEGNYINPYANLVRGYKEYNRSNLNAQFELKQNLSFITEGLSVRALFNTSRYSFFDVSRGYNPFYYQIASYDRIADKYTLASINEESGTEYLGYSEGQKDISTSTYIETAVNYNTTLTEKHDISGMLVFIMRNSLRGNAGDLQLSLPFRNLGISGRGTYSYDGKYNLELNFGYNGSERFYKTNRFGFFPSIGMAWNVSREDFFTDSDLSEIITNFKLKATYGLIGNDAIGSDYDRFFYLSNVNMNDAQRGRRFGRRYDYSRSGVSISRYSNQDITWEKSIKSDIGFEMSLFNDLAIEFDYFNEYRSNILMDRSYIPTTMGLSSSIKANIGEAQSYGIDGSINYMKTINNHFWITSRANFTFAASQFKVFEEPNYNEKHLLHVGQSLSRQWGYIAERLFIDEADVENSPKQNFGEYGPGDIKFHDVNGDGEITKLDMVPIGFPTDPEIMYGFGFSLGYKNVDFSCFFQGSARSTFWIDAASTSPFNNQTQLLKAYAESYWSEDNRNVYALWPRLSPNINNNNVQRSTWYMRDGAFLRLKSIEFGYTLPEKITKILSLSNLRLYASGINLYTFSKFKLWDPEMGGRGLDYPIQKTANVGLQITF
jgi:TonB-linked SusC/RagA family outer membrane protein